MVCVGLLERDLKNVGGPLGGQAKFGGGTGPPGTPLAPPLVTKQSGMQKLHCRLDGYVCRGQQWEIERMHPTPGKRISMEISVAVGLQT